MCDLVIALDFYVAAKIIQTTLMVESVGFEQTFKGVLNPNFRPFSYELKKIRLFEMNYDLGFRVL